MCGVYAMVAAHGGPGAACCSCRASELHRRPDRGEPARRRARQTVTYAVEVKVVVEAEGQDMSDVCCLPICVWCQRIASHEQHDHRTKKRAYAMISQVGGGGQQHHRPMSSVLVAV